MSFLTPFSPLQAARVAFIACLMGFLGGLVASAIKRDQGVKDWGHLIEGHGGMIDRADSLVFAAPVFFHIVRYFWTVKRSRSSRIARPACCSNSKAAKRLSCQGMRSPPAGR